MSKAWTPGEFLDAIRKGIAVPDDDAVVWTVTIDGETSHTSTSVQL